MWISLIIIIISIILLIGKCHIDQYNTISNDPEILQIEDISKTQLENIIKSQNPIVIHKFNESPDFQPDKKDSSIIYLTNSFPNKHKGFKTTIQDLWFQYPNIKTSLSEYTDILGINDGFRKMTQNYHSPLHCKYIENIIAISKDKKYTT